MEQDTVVVGAGISGLSFAHFCATEGHKVTVYEKDSYGGCINSKSSNGNYFFEMGAHSLTNRYNCILSILEHYNQTGEIQESQNLKFEGYSGDFQSIMKPLSFGQLLYSIPVLLWKSKDGQTVKSYYSSILGKNNYESLFHHLFKAILCQSPDRFPASLLFQKRSRNNKYPKKFTLKNGIQQLLNVIIDNPAINYMEHCPITRITFANGEYSLWDSEKNLIKAKNLCLSAPANISASLLRECEPQLANLLDQIKTVKVETLLVGFTEKDKLTNRNKSILGIEQPFYSAIYHENENEKFWVFHFQAEQYNEVEKIQVISEIFDVSTEEIELLGKRVSQLPAIQNDDMGLLREIDQYTKKKSIYIAANYMEGLALEDCCVRAKKEANRLKESLF